MMKKMSIAIVLVVVLLGVLYMGRHKIKALLMGSSISSSQTSQMTQQSSTAAAPSDNIYLTKTDPSKGSYLTDFQGMTLYTFDKDTTGVSNCDGKCAAAWPPYTSGATAQSSFPANITVITRSDGSKQFAWKGMPLYYFVSDTNAGEITGDGVNGFHLAK